MSARSLFIGMILLSTVASCSKHGMLDELGPNRWEEDIPNPIVIDSVVTEVMNPTVCSIYVHFTFDKEAFEAEWAGVDTILMDLGYIGQLNRPDAKVVIERVDEGWVATSKYAYTRSRYMVRGLVFLKNGRVTAPLENYRFSTPEYE